MTDINEKSSPLEIKMSDPLLNNFTQIKNTSKYRWIILFLMGMGEFIFLYILNICQGIQKPLQNKDGMNLSSTEYNLFASLANYPNIIILLFSGTLIDMLDKNKTLIFLSIIFCISQFIFTLGTLLLNYPIMLLGRIIFGFIGQTLFIVLMKNVALWFSKEEYGLAISIFTSLGRLGLSICSIITPFVYEQFNSLFFPCFIGFILTFVNLIGCIISYFIERKIKSENLIEEVKREKFRFDFYEFINSFKFNKFYWLNNLALFFGYASIWGFVFDGNDILTSLYDFSISTSGYIVSFLFINYIVFACITGYIIRKTQKLYTILSIVSVLIGLFSFITFELLYLSHNDETRFISLIPAAGLGAYYGIFNVCEITIINLIIKEDKLAKSFGITWSIIALSESLSPTFLGIIKDKTSDMQFGYFWVLIFLFWLAFLQFLPLFGMLFCFKKEKSHFY